MPDGNHITELDRQSSLGLGAEVTTSLMASLNPFLSIGQLQRALVPSALRLLAVHRVTDVKRPILFEDFPVEPHTSKCR
jgi:hypothetical protein